MHNLSINLPEDFLQFIETEKYKKASNNKESDKEKIVDIKKEEVDPHPYLHQPGIVLLTFSNLS
jgi:hypothetical protein